MYKPDPEVKHKVDYEDDNNGDFDYYDNYPVTARPTGADCATTTLNELGEIRRNRQVSE